MERTESVERGLAKNTILFFIGSIGSKFLSYLLIPFYTAILSTKDYGICDTIFTTVSLLYPVLTFSIGEAVFRFAIDKTSNHEKVWTVGLIVGGIGFGITWAFSPLLLLSRELSPYYWLFVCYYLSCILESLFSQYSKGCNRVKDNTIAGLVTTLLKLLLIISFLKWFHWGINGYLLAHIVSNAIFCIIVFLLIGRDYFKITIIDFQLMKKMFKYSLPIIPNAASWWISTSSDKYIINYFCGYDITGIYAISYKIPSLMTTITGVFLSAWQITSAEEYDSSDSTKIFNRLYNFFYTLLLLSVALLIPLTRIIAKILFANDFYEAWHFVPLLLFAFLFHDLAAFVGSTYTASKKTKALFVSTLIGAVANIALNFLLIPIWGANGAALATFVSYFFVWLFTIINSSSLLRIKIDYFNHILCFSLISIEIGLEMINAPVATLLCFICFLIIIFLNISTIKEIVNSITVAIKNKIKRGQK